MWFDYLKLYTFIHSQLHVYLVIQKEYTMYVQAFTENVPYFETQKFIQQTLMMINKTCLLKLFAYRELAFLVCMHIDSGCNI